MEFIADLHVHGRYAKACSKDTTLKLLEQRAQMKGIDLLGTGDFAHPLWQAEIKQELKDEHGQGVYRSIRGYPFIMQMEISLIYTHLGKGRRVHHVILAPSIEVVEQITQYLKSHGRVDYDGRPIFNISSEQLVADLRSISTNVEVIPAHIWTPWFAMFGSKSGYDSLKDCFGNQAKHIHAIETGMASDPQMNWRLPQLDDKQIVSFSDAHSSWPWRLGREATIFEGTDITYHKVLRAIRTSKGLTGTIEVEPAYGKYHWDGHRKCGVCFSPAQSKKHNNLCPVCSKPLTIGVDNRVEELSKRPASYVKKNAPEYLKLIPLHELIGSVAGQGITTKKVWGLYNRLIDRFKNENNVLMKASVDELKRVVDEKLALVILANREQRIQVTPGFDGVYGKVDLGIDEEKIMHTEQRGLQDFFS